MSAPPPDPPLRVDRVAARAWRIMVVNERMVVNPIARRAVDWVAWLIPAAVAGVGGFDGWARSAAQRDDDLLDILSDGDAALVAAGVGAFLIGVVVSSWLLVAFCASVRDGRPQLRAPLGAIARISLLEAVAIAAILGAILANEILGLLVFLAVNVLLLYAPYVIALTGAGLVESLVIGLRILRRAPGTAFVILALAFLLARIGYALLEQPIVDATTVFAVLVLAAILYEGLVSYVVDCTVIAAIVESEGAPASASATAPA